MAQNRNKYKIGIEKMKQDMARRKKRKHDANNLTDKTCDNHSRRFILIRL